jgi:hypothetical protein
VTGTVSSLGGGRRGAFSLGASVLHVKAVAGDNEEDDEEQVGGLSGPWLLRTGVVVHLEEGPRDALLHRQAR